MTDCVYFLLYLALGKLSLMLLINYYYYYINVDNIIVIDGIIACRFLSILENILLLH